MPRKITLYIDIVSPFAYQGYWLTRNSPAFTQSNIQITYVPILLGGLMIATGNRPPLEIKNKDKWIDAQRLKRAADLGIPLMKKTPDPFPQSTVNTMRALCFIQEEFGEGKFVEAIDALYKAFWVEGKSPIGKVEVLGEVLRPVFGEEGVRRVLEGAKGEVAKGKLKSNTEMAFKDGGFGLPWFVAENEKGEKEGFWGVDHAGQLLEFLGVEVKAEGGRYKSML